MTAPLRLPILMPPARTTFGRCTSISIAHIKDIWNGDVVLRLQCEEDQWHCGFDLIGIPKEAEHHCVKDGANYKWRT